MKRLSILTILLIFLFNNSFSQNLIDEEKVKKAVVLMKKMMDNPDAMMTIYAELETLKLSNVEKKEAEKRMQQQAKNQIADIKKDAITTGGKSETQVRQLGNNNIPTKDANKIAAIPATPSPTALNSYLQKLTNAVQTALPQVITEESNRFFEILKTETKNAREMGEAVIGLWLSGRPEHAVLVAGKVCMTDNSYAENINNYAAILNMMDAQHMAVPLLQMLNRQYPGNATILGNLGQSWFGLGDLNVAKKYLDSAIRFFPKHSQANHTKSIIQEANGDKKGAIESEKASMETGYTDVKAARLRKLGFTGKKNVSWPLHIPQDPLGFNKFKLPDFPLDIDECIVLRPVWEEHWKQMRQLENTFGEKMSRLQMEAEKYESQVVESMVTEFGQNKIIQTGPGPLSTRASAKLSYLLDEDDGGLSYKLRKAEENMLALGGQLKKLDDIRKNAIEVFEKQKLDCGDGEGSSGKDKDACCQAINNINNSWLASTNKLMKNTFEEAIDIYKRHWSAEAYFLQYNLSEPTFEATKAKYKYLFAGIMATIVPNFASISPSCNTIPKSNPFKQKPLQDYDDVNCKYYSRLDFKFLVIESKCSQMTTKIDLGKFKTAFTEDLNKNKGILPGAITNGSVDISVSIGNKGLGKWGPVKAEAGAGVDIHLEMDEQGHQEASVTVKGEVTIGTDLIDKAEKIESLVKKGGVQYMEKEGVTALVPIPKVGNKSASVAGAAATISLNSGSSVTGSGALSGLKF